VYVCVRVRVCVCDLTRTEVTRVYYGVWWSGQWLSPVDDRAPSALDSSLQTIDLVVYSGAEQNLVRVRSVLIRGERLSVAASDDVAAAIQQAWRGINRTNVLFSVVSQFYLILWAYMLWARKDSNVAYSVQIDLASSKFTAYIQHTNEQVQAKTSKKTNLKKK